VKQDKKASDSSASPEISDEFEEEKVSKKIPVSDEIK